MAQFTLLHRTSRSKPGNHTTDLLDAQVSPMRLVLRMADRRQMISVQLADRLLIGRGSGNRQPDIDLEDFDGAKCGVSRWHAVIIYDENNNLFVEDLNSTNGTRINGYRIDAGSAYRLRNGDELELGTLCLLVSIVRPPSY